MRFGERVVAFERLWCSPAASVFSEPISDVFGEGRIHFGRNCLSGGTSIYCGHEGGFCGGAAFEDTRDRPVLDAGGARRNRVHRREILRHRRLQRRRVHHSTVQCPPSNSCQLQGSCNPTSGTCSFPTVADGTSCNDGDLCDIAFCQSGACVANEVVSCPTSNPCLVSSCDSATGQCGAPTAYPDGTTCNDGNACTLSDTCQAGSCVGARTRWLCSSPDAVSRRPVLQSGERNLWARRRRRRHGVQRRQQLHVDGRVRRRHVRRLEPRRLCAALDAAQRHVAGGLRPLPSGICSEPAYAERHGLHENDGNSLHSTGDVCTGGRVRRSPPGHVRGVRPMPRSRPLQSGDRRVLQPRSRRAAPRATTGTRARRATHARTARAWGLRSRALRRSARRAPRATGAVARSSTKPTARAAGRAPSARRARASPGATSVASSSLRATRAPPTRARSACPRAPRPRGPRGVTARAADRPPCVHRVHVPGVLHRRRAGSGLLAEPRQLLSGLRPICLDDHLVECGERSRVRRLRQVFHWSLRARRAPASARTRSSAPRRTSATWPAPATRRRARCSNPAEANGSACNDGNACTQTDTCQAGVCTGSTR